MSDYTPITCTECGADIKLREFPFGNDVQCTECGVWFKTDMEESDDSLYCWATKKSDDQNQGS